MPDETLVDIYYDLCDIEATALTRKGNLTSRGKEAAELAELFGDVIAVYGSYYWDGDDDFSDYDDYFDRGEKYDPARRPIRVIAAASRSRWIPLRPSEDAIWLRSPAPR